MWVSLEPTRLDHLWDPTWKRYARLERSARDKYSSLLRSLISYKEKRFYQYDPKSQCLLYISIFKYSQWCLKLFFQNFVKKYNFCLSIHLSLCLFVCSSICPLIWLCLCLSVLSSVCLSARLSDHLSVCSSVFFACMAGGVQYAFKTGR
jgi:hypothetical protein